MVEALPTAFRLEAQPGSDPEPGDSSADPLAGPIDVAEHIDAQDRRVGERSPQAKEAELERRVKDLQAVRPESLQGIQNLIESATGADQDERAYAPVPGAEGAFDPHSALLYDMVKKEDGPEGSVVYVWIMVDKAGRTLEQEVPQSQMSPQDMTAFRIFEMSRGQPMMRRLLDTVRKIGAQRLEQMEQTNSKPRR
jgi:hypothetical protein